ncbi:MAG: endonuclease MutS2 [Bacteroidales bacterium]|nr:endonuclease MutS2 [Bacteroidales bacterium]MCF8397948.1 endonuclease MutS2 [Bacteroidales bacterium]
MIYPAAFENKIGFDQIRELLKDRCLSELGEEYVHRISFSSDFESISYALSIAVEFKSLLELKGNFPAQDYLNLTPELNRVKLEGTIIELEKIFDFKVSLRALIEITQYLEKLDREDYPLLTELTKNLYDPQKIFKRLEQIMDDKGGIRDKASPKLAEIRKKLRGKKGEISGRMQKSLKTAKSSGWTNKDAEPTIRSGRLVIPVSVTHKRKVQGFIHDESASGQTVYIEPAEVFDANNEIREIENAERREINKILSHFTDMLRPHLPEILELYDFMGRVDFIRAKAKLGIDLDGAKPELHETPGMEWLEARHPLLFLSFQSQGKKVVPLNIMLNRDQRIMVISGPNAGGKSVCLKTVGLIQYMIQCGIPAPMKADSKTGIFDKIFLDIGDEQSLENDLSTYSSHLLNIKYFVVNLNQDSLFLIDEFGAGTEPQLGGAIAESVLEKINAIEAYGVITTHYANLKIAADEMQGVSNAAMLFDSEKLEPLYILKSGKPGSSFAFEIARHIGFPPEILDLAIEKTGTSQIDFEKQLQQLEKDKLDIDKKKTELRVADDFLAEMIAKYEKLNEELERSKVEILKDAKSEAQKIISGSNKLIENTIREIREIQAQKDKTRDLRKKVEQEKLKIEKLPEKPKKKKTEKKKPLKEDSPIQKGDHVKIEGQEKSGEVENIKDGQALVSFDTFKLNISLDKLQKTGRSGRNKKKGSGKYGSILNDMRQKMEDFKSTIDIRGERAEEAIAKIRNYIDDAILLNIKEVQIIHGKGSGILRDAIRQYLSTVDEIQHYQDAHPDRGGHGITIVTLS